MAILQYIAIRPGADLRIWPPANPPVTASYWPAVWPEACNVRKRVCRAQEALEDERTARIEAEALASKLRSQLASLRDVQSSQQRSAQDRLGSLQARLQSLAARVVRPW